MPPKKRPSSSSAHAAEDYSSDGGFVADAPSRSKKAKKNINLKEGRTAGEGGGGGGGGGGSGAVGGKGVEEDGEEFWELSSKRRISVQEYKGTTNVNIREYYEKDGQMLPGKKGITLPIEQFNTLIRILPQLEASLSKKGKSVERPDYSGVEKEPEQEGEEEDEGGDGGSGGGGGVGVKKEGKKNFEETSDEE